MISLHSVRVLGFSVLLASIVGCGGGASGDDPCAPTPCTAPGPSICLVEDGAAVCACPDGQVESDGVCAPVKECDPASCNGHGTCSQVDGAIGCDCDEGHAGPACEHCDDAEGWHDDGAGGCTMDPCVPNPCTAPNQSVCEASEEGHVCRCDDGYHDDGGGCVPDEVCDETACANGLCEVDGGIVQCECDPGWAGDACDACDAAGGYHHDGAGGCTMDPCLPSPCTMPSKGQCTDEGGQAVCSCDDGYHDDGVGGCTDDPCVPDPCAAQGQACRVGDGGGAECYTPVCDDDNPCTDDVFEPGGCVFTPAIDGTPCSTTLCTSDQICSGGMCGGGVQVSCDDGNACTADSCDALTGCQNLADDSLVPDDGIACTIDQCTGGNASHVPDDLVCDDQLFCTGVERCLPTSAAADGLGCVTTESPQRPPSDGPCRSWGACDETIDGFPEIVLPAGASCDDRIACTTGDVCDVDGLCAGTVTADCGEPGTCTAIEYLPAVLDVPTTHLSGTITANGAPLPTTSPSSGSILFYLVAKDTGAWHRIETIGFGGSYPSYTRGGDGTYETRVMPGVYDLLYRRNYYVDSNYAHETEPDDLLVHGLRLLETDVIIGAGSQVLDIDIPSTQVSGTITANGGPLPAASPSSGSIHLYLVAKDTGAWHRIETIGFGGSYPSYTRGGDETYAARVPDGVYDLMYRRNYYQDDNYAYETDPDDLLVHGLRLLDTDIVIGGGAQTLDVDVGSVALSGTITANGAPMPATSPSSGSMLFYLVAKDTGAWHRIETIGFGGSYPSYTRGGDGTYATRVPPGTYDVLYRRNYYADDNYAYETDPDDLLVHGLRVLANDVVLDADATLDIDISSTKIAGTITANGGPLPATSPSSGSMLFYLVAKDTGAWHRIETIGFGGSYPNYTRGGDGTYETRVPAGVYDLMYRRNYYQDDNYAYETDPDDLLVHGLRLLETDVVVGAGAATQTIDIDIPSAHLSGTFTANGGPLPATSPSSGSILLYLVAEDTGAWHRIETIGFGGSYPNYTRGGDGTYETRVPPGVYDLLYRRNYYADDNYAYETEPDDLLVHGLRVLADDIVIGTGPQSLDIDIPSASLAGAYTFDGAPPPATSPSSGSILWYLVAPETGALHRIETVGFGGSYPDYIHGGDGTYETRVMPGVYHLRYRRNYYADDNYAYETDPDDRMVHAYRDLGMCVAVD